MKEEMLKNEMWLLVRAIAEGIEDTLAPAAEESGLTLTQVRVLMCCMHQPDLTAGELAKRSGMAAANLSSMCKRLEGQGLLYRLRDPEDERLVHIRLTVRGEAAMRTMDAAIQSRYGSIFSEEDPEEIAQILAGLQKLNALLKRLGRKPEKPEK